MRQTSAGSTTHPLHIVWDWNGTLLDDVQLAVQATAASLTGKLRGQLTVERFRENFSQPLRKFYERLLERTVDDDELRQIIERYRSFYYKSHHRCQLRSGALEVLSEFSSQGHQNSLLSLADHNYLTASARHFGIADRFTLIEGSRHRISAGKTLALARHLEKLKISSPDSRVIVVGDTPEDAAAASILGLEAILVEHGYATSDALRKANTTRASNLRRIPKKIKELIHSEPVKVSTEPTASRSPALIGTDRESPTRL
ncbi:HAD family hydrolase [Streptomyces chartreusis]|uniref:HAD family hydrolase n=1 Tax=Streptomyces chartreusis TaxID=1969 RepID=UPI00368A3796